MVDHQIRHSVTLDISPNTKKMSNMNSPRFQIEIHVSMSQVTRVMCLKSRLKTCTVKAIQKYQICTVKERFRPLVTTTQKTIGITSTEMIVISQHSTQSLLTRATSAATRTSTISSSQDTTLSTSPEVNVVANPVQELAAKFP